MVCANPCSDERKRVRGTRDLAKGTQHVLAGLRYNSRPLIPGRALVLPAAPTLDR